MHKRKCIVCQKGHPSTLHGGKGLSVHFASMPSMSISMCVVQVQLWHKDNPDVRTTVYALLDECCNGTFIKDDILESLNVPAVDRGPHLPVKVNTIIGAKEQGAGGAKGLIVQAIESHRSIYHDSPTPLPYTYARSFLAVGSEETPTPSRIRPWSYRGL